MKTWDLNLKIESEIILNSFWKILFNSSTLDAEVNTITNRWRVKDKILLVEVACSLRVTKPHISESVSFSLSISSLSLYFSLLLIILCTTYMYQISVYTKRMLRFNVLQNVSLFARCTLFFLNIRYLHASQRALRFAIFIYPRLLYREMFHLSR